MWPVDSQENPLKCCHQMSHFKAEMHQIRFTAIAALKVAFNNIFILHIYYYTVHS